MLADIVKSLWNSKHNKKIIHDQQTSFYENGRRKISAWIHTRCKKGSYTTCKSQWGHQNTMIVHIVMNTLPTSFESFIQSTIAQDVLPSFENLIGKFFLEKQKRKTKFGK